LNLLIEELRAALWSVWNRRWLALAVAVGLLPARLARPRVHSRTAMNRRRACSCSSTTCSPDQIGIGADARKQDIERMRQTLVSATNLEKIIRSTKIGETVTSPGQMERAVASLGEDIKLVGDEKNVFTLTVTSGRTTCRRRECPAWRRTSRCADRHRPRDQPRRQPRRDARDDRVPRPAARAAPGQLEQAEQRRLAFEAEHPEMIGGAVGISTQLANNRAELRSVEADLRRGAERACADRRQLAGTPRTLVTAGAGGPRAALAQA
jgi:hypothetical protein